MTGLVVMPHPCGPRILNGESRMADKQVAQVSGGGVRDDADALRLANSFAAAPDLVAALRPLLARAEILYDQRAGEWNSLRLEIEAARAALAKSGQSQ